MSSRERADAICASLLTVKRNDDDNITICYNYNSEPSRYKNKKDWALGVFPAVQRSQCWGLYGEPIASHVTQIHFGRKIRERNGQQRIQLKARQWTEFFCHGLKKIWNYGILESIVWNLLRLPFDSHPNPATAFLRKYTTIFNALRGWNFKSLKLNVSNKRSKALMVSSRV